MNENMEERLLDLLCKQAVYGLTEEETRELKELELTVQSPVDLRSLEMTAAAISLSAVGADEHLSDHLKSSILAEADKYFDVKRSADRPLTVPVQIETRSPIWNWIGWAVAAAACVALAANVWISNSRGLGDRTDIQTPTPAPEKLTPSQLRERFMASAEASDMVKAEWGPGNVEEVTSLSGDVVWSDAKQEGYMRFRGLPANDTSKYTYQLWIFDETQSEKTPIDGGTFDVNAEGEIVIPIDPNLRARGAKAFAITMEKPGGVMVSERKQVVTLAAVKQNQA